MEVWISRNDLYETVITTDSDVVSAICTLYKDAVVVPYLENSQILAYNITYRKEKPQ